MPRGSDLLFSCEVEIIVQLPSKRRRGMGGVGL
jgi:hypothetical protein